MSSLVWFYRLIHEELKRQRGLLKQKGTQDVSIEEIKALPEDAEKAAGYDALRPLDIIQEELEPSVIRTEGLIPDPEAVPPDELASEKDILAQLPQDIRNWPRPEREVLELYFVEGLEAEEIAMITSRPLKTVRKSIASIQQRLREEILGKSLL